MHRRRIERLGWLSLLGLLASGCAGSGGTRDDDAGPGICAADVDCDDGLFCTGTRACRPQDADADPRGCVDQPPCEAAERCVEADAQCVPEGCDGDGDADSDGFLSIACGGTDCDDDDPLRNPGAVEVCDAEDRDEDCDPDTFGARDEDDDGFVDIACCNVDGDGVRHCGGDCDDGNGSAFPQGTEICNDVDEDCDGDADEGLEEFDYRPDCDGDTHGDNDATPVRDCRAPAAAPSCGDLTGTWITTDGDCDDQVPSQHRGAAEMCNGVDDDCDGETDEEITPLDFYPDCDNDRYGDEGATPVRDCQMPASAPDCGGAVGSWATRGDDCDDAVATTFTGAPELCNEIDDDCDEGVDETLETHSYRPDCDLDDWGDEGATPVVDCRAPADPPSCAVSGVWVETSGDCNDADAFVSPGEAESCNGVDDDCSGDVDDVTADNVVICTAGSVEPCTNACGVAGTVACNSTCTAFSTCSSALSEVCNYCDDSGGTDLSGDLALATTDRATEILSCAGGDAAGMAFCAPRGSAMPPFLFDATVLQGLGEDRAGAIFFTPADWVSGYGQIEVDVTLRVNAVPANGDAAVGTALGGWALGVVTEGSPAVGAANAHGIPSGIRGVAARWHWAGFNCDNAAFPPDQGDRLSVVSLPATVLRPTTADDTGAWTCADRRTAFATGTDRQHFSNQTGVRRQRMRMRYLPDDPTTPGVNEETVEVIAGDAVALTVSSSDALSPDVTEPISPGTAIRMFISAGTYSDTFNVLPGNQRMGVPVRAQVQLYRQVDNTGQVFDQQEAFFRVEDVCAP